jgi:lipopolysaccharide export system ATP-binding protein
VTPGNGQTPPRGGGGAPGGGGAASVPIPADVRELVAEIAGQHRSLSLLLGCVLTSADASGAAILNDVAIVFRDRHLQVVRAEGRDAERESGRLSLDEVRNYLARSLLPRLARTGVLELPPPDEIAPDVEIAILPAVWARLEAYRYPLAEELLAIGQRPAGAAPPIVTGPVATGHSVLEARGLVKIYRRRKVVNDVALRLRQGEIVGLLGPNGAGKTTVFYMIVGLIPPVTGRILLDGVDITEMPMYRRARRGVGYLSQEPSVFRKLSVEDNVMAILETMPLTNQERHRRLEHLLDELSIKHLRQSKAYALSGGERRRLEITRALVTQPKFMMLDEPFAGVDPIAVHDIQTIVAGLRHRGIGVLISDHNVEQTLDIVDRAYIMFDGKVQVSGTVRELVYDEKVAEIYLGPTLTARLRGRFSAS